MTFRDDLARDGRHFAVKCANKQVEVSLVDWNQRWVLDGVSVSCIECGGAQLLSESGTTFEGRHAADCDLSKLPFQMPFGQLAEILSGWCIEIWDEDGNIN